MNRSFICRIAQILHLVALSIWLGSVAMSGVVAAIVFPLMRKLEPTLASYPDYKGDHAMLAGGRLASSVFLAVDTIQFVCASLALATLVIMIVTGYTINTIPRLLRIMVLCATLALLSYHLFVFMPQQMLSLRGYWDFAAAGDTSQADMFKDKFLASHSAASRILGTLTIAVLINIILAGWTLTAAPKETPAND
ncbi:MAG: hypothetical protein JKX70_05910 [Phycisphaerales bacterium]|nr:hypothetical protein [Phycisphaerales bacterium]